MKKVIVASVVVVATVWVVASLTARGAAKVAAGLEWPMGLGRMEDVPKKYEDVTVGAGRIKVMREAKAADWDELRGEWAAAKALWDEPVSSIAAHALTRRVLDRARELPRPAPAWIEEIRTFDYRRAHLAAMQVETWQLADAIDKHAATRGIAGPYWRLARADYVQWRRNAAWALVRGYSADSPAWWNRPVRTIVPDVNAEWAEALQLEKDANALRR